MALKKRQWHEAHGSQQPDWGKQLCASSEQLGFTGLGTTLVAGGGRSFERTGTSLGFWKIKKDRKRETGWVFVGASWESTKSSVPLSWLGCFTYIYASLKFVKVRSKREGQLGEGEYHND